MNQPTCTPSDAMLKDLAKSGISPELAGAVGILPLTNAEIISMYPERKGQIKCDGFLIPYGNPDGSLPEFARVKLLEECVDQNGKGFKYLQHKGSKPRLYFQPSFPHLSAILADPSQDLYITEGEKKALALCAIGISAVGLGGVWSWKNRESEHSNPIDDLMLIQWQGRRVFIVFDSDAKYKPQVMRAAIELGNELFRRGARPYFVEVPTLPGQTKTGIDDYIISFESNRRERVLALPARSLGVPDTITARELMSMTFEKKTFVVEGLLSVGLTILAGAPKIGKSWFLLNICLAVIDGRTALQIFKTRQCSVLYLALEETKQRLDSRVRQLTLGEVSTSFDRLHLQTHWPSIEDDGLQKLDRFLETHPDCKLVVIDTLQRLRAREMGARGVNQYERDYDVISPIKQLADRHKVCIVLVTHTKKGRVDDAYEKVSGSMAITGAADTNMILERGRGEQNALLQVTGRDIDEASWALEFAEGHWLFLGDAAQVMASAARKEVIDLLRRRGPLQPKDISDELEKTSSAIRKLLRKMVDAGELTQGQDGRYAAHPIDISKRGRITGVTGVPEET